YFCCSSRRRHTRFSRDWSSDVCSSDLAAQLADGALELLGVHRLAGDAVELLAEERDDLGGALGGAAGVEADDARLGVGGGERVRDRKSVVEGKEQSSQSAERSQQHPDA